MQKFMYIYTFYFIIFQNILYQIIYFTPYFI